MTTNIWSSVDCFEVYGGKAEDFNIQTGLNHRVRLQCAWTDRYALIQDLLVTPRPWPHATGLVPYAISASAQPLPNEAGTTDNQLMNFTQAIVDVNYSTAIIDVASESIEPNMEAVPLDHTYFNWGGIGGPKLLEGEAPPLILRSLNLVRTRYRLSVVSNDVIALVGYVNEAAYTSSLLGLTFPIDTLLYLPSPIIRSFTTLSSSGFTVTERFSYKPQGWNKYWRAKTQAWDSIYLSGQSTPALSYPRGDFAANLFS